MLLPGEGKKRRGGRQRYPPYCAKPPAKIPLLFFCFFHRIPRHLCDGGYSLFSISFSAMADWCRSVAASQPRYPTSHRRINDPHRTHIHPTGLSKQSIHPSHPSTIQSITTHGTCPSSSTSFSRGCLSFLLLLSAYLLLSGVLYELR